MQAGVIFTHNGSDGVRLDHRGANEGTQLDNLPSENDR